MSLLLSLALRNLTRNLRRTLITSVAVVLGTALLILGQGFVDGLDENVIRAAEEGTTGHVLLRPESWPEDTIGAPLDEARVPPPGLLERLGSEAAWAPRLWFEGRLIHGPDAVRTRYLAYDEARDPAVFPRDGWKVDGAWPADPGQVLLSHNLARLLGVGTGDLVIAETRTLTGAINALQFTVSGVLRTGNMSLDAPLAWVPQSTADRLVFSEGARSQLAVRLDGGRRDAKAAAARLSGDGWRGHTAVEEVADLLATNDIRRRAMSLLIFILMAIAATGIANTVVMATYERVREIGTLRAMGLSEGGVRALFVLEGGLLGLLAGAAGAVLGTVAVRYWSVNGIDLSESAAASQMSDFSFSMTLYTAPSWPVVAFAFSFGAIVAVLSSLYPAWHASRLNPADAVRAD